MTIVPETSRNANSKAVYTLAIDLEVGRQVGRHAWKVECHKLNIIQWKGYGPDNITWEPWENMVSELVKN